QPATLGFLRLQHAHGGIAELLLGRTKRGDVLSTAGGVGDTGIGMVYREVNEAEGSVIDQLAPDERFSSEGAGDPVTPSGDFSGREQVGEACTDEIRRPFAKQSCCLAASVTDAATRVDHPRKGWSLEEERPLHPSRGRIRQSSYFLAMALRTE